ncbi:MAG TPA: hypothetical protein VK911_03125 [Vicinamibacterales bacterium]|nr:hypothetical protein [Vicinamibacterales bacterium]
MSHPVRSLISAAGLAALVVAGPSAQSALGNLGVSEARAKTEIVSSLADGYVPVNLAARAFLAAPPATRAAMVKTAMAWAKGYTESAAFRAEYEQRRAADAPEPPDAPGGVDEELAAQKAQQRKQLEEARANLANLPPELRKEMEAALKQIADQTAAMDKDPQMAAMRRQGLEAQRADKERAYRDRVAAHERRFPADPRTLIARRLTEFLEMSKDVDFNAALAAGGGGKRVFANAAYEEKPPEWKLCYRAGAEPVQAARAFAAEWLKSLGAR